MKVGDRTVTAKNIIIATGSSVTPLPGVDVDNAGAKIVNSTGALALPEVPKRMVVIGGGVIGLELGSVWRRLGAEVTVVEFLDQILPGMDGDVRKESNKIFKKQGFDFRLSTKVTGAKVNGSGHAYGRAFRRGHRRDDRGRRGAGVDRPTPEHRGLGLDKIGLKTNKRGQIETDHEFRTSVPGVWAIGDVIPGPMLAHKAEDEGIAVAENIAGHTGIVNHDVIPSVVYTYPEIAGVGLTEEDAKKDGEVKVGKFPMLANSRAKTNREPDGFVKVIADAKTDRVLGVWMISTVAGTMIAQAAQAMEFGATSEDIAYTCHAHPTHGEALKEAAMAVPASQFTSSGDACTFVRRRNERTNPQPPLAHLAGLGGGDPDPALDHFRPGHGRPADRGGARRRFASRSRADPDGRSADPAAHFRRDHSIAFARTARGRAALGGEAAGREDAARRSEDRAAAAGIVGQRRPAGGRGALCRQSHHPIRRSDGRRRSPDRVQAPRRGMAGGDERWRPFLRGCIVRPGRRDAHGLVALLRFHVGPPHHGPGHARGYAQSLRDPVRDRRVGHERAWHDFPSQGPEKKARRLDS